ncbi:MAG TPA: hypothetical protein VIF83_10750 [Gemmatimonadaceae bacterium]
MKQSRLCLVAIALLAGCAENPAEPPVYHIIKPDEGFVALTVKVSGDPRLIESFFVRFNAVEWRFRGNTSVNVPLKEGDYTVRLSPPGSREWCNAVEPTTITTRVEAGRTLPLVFSAHCPPQIGSARVRIVVTGSGDSIPVAVTLRLNRVIAAGYSATIRVSVNDSVDIWEPVGMYELTSDIPTRCRPAVRGFEWAYPAPRYAVRSGETTRLGWILNCRATP